MVGSFEQFGVFSFSSVREHSVCTIFFTNLQQFPDDACTRCDHSLHEPVVTDTVLLRLQLNL